MLDELIGALPLLLHWNIWVLTVSGVLIGMVLGALPGVGPAVAVAILTPLTFRWETVDALIFLGVLYPATVYGGSISAILFNVPGHGGSAATVLDGYALSRQGKGAQALGLSAAASFVGGLVGVSALILFSPILARFGLRFGPAENFILGVLGLSIIAVVIRTSTLKGLISALLGLLISTIGYDLVTGEIRYTFGTLYLQDGVPFVQALIGLFAISQAIRLSISGGRIASEARFQGRLVEGSLEVLKYPVTLIRSSIIGTVIGALPGAGMVTASFVSYGEAVRASKHPERFGKGEPEGVIAAEGANNAAILAELIPTITLGIPGGAGVAVFMGAMIMHGITPGPGAFAQGGEAISGLFLGLLLSNFFILLAGLTIAPYFARATLTPNHIIVPTIVVLSIFGSYALRNSIEDVLLTVGFGVLGYVMTQHGFSLIPLILGMVLGPIAEQGFQRALIISQGEVGVFFASATARTMWIFLAIALTAPLYGPWIARIWRSDRNQPRS